MKLRFRNMTKAGAKPTGTNRTATTPPAKPAATRATAAKPATKPATVSTAAPVADKLQTLVVDGETIQGHWRTWHGHKIFIRADGAVYTYNADAKKYEHTPNPHKDLAAALAESGPIIRIKNTGREHYVQVEGITPEVKDAIEKNWVVNRPASTYANDAAWALRDAVEGKPTLRSRMAGLIHALPHAILESEGAFGADMHGMLPGWNKHANISVSTAAGRHRRFLDAVGKTREKVIIGKAKAEKETAKARATAARRTATAAKQSVKASNEVGDIAKLVKELLDSEKGEGQTQLLRLVAAMQHGGFIRESTRGANKGAMIVDETRARAVAADIKAPPQARMAATIALTASVGTETPKRRWPVYPKKDGQTDYDAEPTYQEKVYPRQLKYTGYPEKFFKGAADNVRKAGFRVASLLEDHAASLSSGGGGVAELQNLQIGKASAKDVATGSDAALHSISAANTQAEREAALAAQKNDKWTPPKLFTMEGFGPGAKLHGYQVQGVNWAIVAKRGVNGFGTGLGKSLTMLATALKLNEMKATRQGIIITPVAVVSGITDEARKAAPRAKIVTVTGDAKQRAALLRQAEKADVVIFGASALNDPACLAYIKRRKADASLQVDEVHRYKRRGEGMTKNLEDCIRGREYAIGLTATPTPNYDEDFFNIMDMFRPGSVGTKAQYRGRSLVDAIIEGTAKTDSLDRIHEMSKPWLFTKRRNDPDVKVHVPPHLEVEQWLDKPGDYENWTHLAAEYALKKLTGGPGSMLAFVGMMNTMERMISVSPALVQPHLLNKKVHDYTGGEAKVDDCVDRVMDHVGDGTKRGQPIVVASDFTEGLERVKHRLMAEGIPESAIAEISGRIPQKKRDEAKQKANDGEISVLLLSTMAGGVGLNLQGNKAKGTGPSAMYLLNQPWRKVDLRQVIDRISRQGQQRETTSWLAQQRGTIEDKVHQLVAGKAVVGDVIQHGSENVAKSLGMDIGQAFEKLKLEDQLKMLAIPAHIIEKVKALEAKKVPGKTRTARK